MNAQFSVIVNRVYPVMGKPGKVMEIIFFSPGLEIDSRFWKIHKKSWKLKGILSRNGVVHFFHPASIQLYNEIKFWFLAYFPVL